MFIGDFFMNYTKLATELADVKYNGMTDEEKAAELNVKDKALISPISSTELLAWAGGNQRLLRLEDGAVNHVDDDIKNVCKVALEMIKRDGTQLDLNLADRLAMVGALIAGGVLTVFDNTELEALANTSKQSTADILDLGAVKLGHVKEIK